MEHATVLDLSPPPQRKPGSAGFDLRRRAVARWLAELPAAHLGEASRALLDALCQVNQLNVPPMLRLRFLEAVSPRVEDTVESLRRHYLAKEFPLPERSRKIAELAETLLRETAVGYHAAVSQLTAARWRRERRLAFAVQRTMHMLAKLLVESYSLYAPAPGGLWQNLHRLYELAERHGVAHRPVPVRRLAYGGRCSVTDTYKRILLLAAAGPYRMRHSEAGDVYGMLGRWARHCRLIPMPAAGAPESAFAVDLRTDDPPRYQRTVGAIGGPIRLLDVSALAGLADQGRRPWWHVWHRSRPIPNPDVVRRLVLALGVLPTRQSARLPAKAHIQLVAGLSQIYRSLIAQQGDDAVELGVDAPRFTARDPQPDPLRSDDVWDLIYPSADLLQRVPPAAEHGDPESRHVRPPRTQSWRLLNISAGGYCLLSDPQQTARLQVGELLALRETDDRDGNRQVGVVRWMRQQKDGLHIGVQVLGAEPIPALIRSEQEDGSYGSPERSLLLPQDKASGRAATLLVSPQQWAPACGALLKAPDGEREIVLTRLMEASSGFAQFEFQAVALPAARTAAPDDVFSLV